VAATDVVVVGVVVAVVFCWPVTVRIYAEICRESNATLQSLQSRVSSLACHVAWNNI